jgi:hypothetical protein
MSTRVYKVVFDKSSHDLNEDYEKLSDYEKEKISDLDADSFFDYHDYKDSYVCYIITTPTEFKIYSSILIKNLIYHEPIDISKNILSFKTDLSEELRPLLSSTNSIKYSFFMDDLKDWIYKNLDIDGVLDRITEVGLNNLSSIEKEFLKNFHLP